MLDRRNFLAGAAGAGLLSALPASAGSGRSTITVLADEPVGTISPDLYGYLLENLGTVIYDGVWVGEQSKIANIGGIRRSLIEHLRKIKASVIRWPGGNFADYYDWRDGIGPRGSRPRRTNVWSDEMPKAAPKGPQRYDPNQFGTHEFIQLCRLTGGRPFLNINLRGLTPADATAWVDYCNAPEGTTTLADMRKVNGSAEPFNVDYWGIGNEPWSFGGNMSASEYASHYRRIVSGLPLHGRELKFVAAGGPPSFSDASWTRTFLAEIKRAWRTVPIHGLSVHYYTDFALNHMRPGETVEQYIAAKDNRPRRMTEPLNYKEDAWYGVLGESVKIDALIKANWAAVREYDASSKIKLMVDEWGGIFDFNTDLSPAAIRARAVPLRDALSAALTLDIFHAHADKIANACFTGLINQEGGLFLAEGDRFVATPIYHVFAMYADHQGGRALRTIFDAPRISGEYEGRPVDLSGLSGSASQNGNRLTLTVVNPHVTQPQEAHLNLRGVRIAGMTATTLAHGDIRARNTFDQPRMLEPTMRDLPPTKAGTYVFPPASVTRLSIRIV